MDTLAPIADILTTLSALFSFAGDGLFSSVSGVFDFTVQVQRCDRDLCPGSQFTLAGASWANMGYMAHADLLHMLSATEFGHWAPLIYVCAAIGALIGVAMNMPPKGYIWFFLGPSLYSFLVGTTQEIRGVDWVVANQQQDMTEVWRNSEVLMRNLEITDREGIPVSKDGPGALYQVAMPLVFLDSLFSNSANFLVEYSGLYRQAGEGGRDSNLARQTGTLEGPWYLLSNLKWGLLENIVSGTARNANIRDALVSFLGSECGDQFKKSIDSGKYIAAAQSKGINLPLTVMTVPNPTDISQGEYGMGNYTIPLRGLSVTSIPTPRTLLRLFQEPSTTGSFGEFTKIFYSAPGGKNLPLSVGRDQTVVCSEYLYTLVQAFRWEAGHAYWQLIRAAPNGLNRDQFLKGLFYGWNIRRSEDADYADYNELNAFVKHLILMYIVRNEMMFAPQVTTFDQRFAPSEQARINGDSQVRTMGSKAKFAELYNWAVLMPYLQGILLYFVIMAYPFAAMMMVLPGHHKTFFTWISFFAWLKLWDVGFAFIQVLERSVWAMLGNQSATARIAHLILDTASTAGGIGVACPGGSTLQSSSLESLCAIPQVCSVVGSLNADTCQVPGRDQPMENSMFLFDRLLLLGSSADLDLANGYYIYIMAALYMAVPAVTGQLVLGAKSGAGNMAGNMFNSVAGEAGSAAKMGYQHDATNRALSNAGSLSQAAYGKAMRAAEGGGKSLAQGVFDSQKGELDAGLRGEMAGLEKQNLSNRASIASINSQSFDKAQGVGKSIAGAGAAGLELIKDFDIGAQDFARGVAGMDPTKRGGGGGGSGVGSGNGGGSPATDKSKDSAYLAGRTIGANIDYAGGKLSQEALGKNAESVQKGAGFDAQAKQAGLESRGYGVYGSNQRAGAEYEAKMAEWEARNAFASHASAQAGIAGMNTGSLAAQHKPTDLTGMAMSGQLNAAKREREGSNWEGSFVSSSNVSGAANYANPEASGGFFSNANGQISAWSAANGEAQLKGETKLQGNGTTIQNPGVGVTTYLETAKNIGGASAAKAGLAGWFKENTPKSSNP
jgi:hypothetical protein